MILTNIELSIGGLVAPMTWGKKNKKLTTHDVVQLYVFKGWNFSPEFKRRAIAQENSLNKRKWNKAGVIFFSQIIF